MVRLLGFLICVSSFAVLANNTANSQTPDQKRVVVVDDSSVIYAETGQPYANVIATAISTIPGVSVTKEWVAADWTRELDILAIGPDLIVVHTNAFSISTDDARGYTRLTAFVRQFESKRTMFLLYSRSPYLDVAHVSRSLIDGFSNDTGLSPQRFDTFSVRSEDSEQIDINRLKQKVRRLLSE